jgi:hypothetical protein
MNDLSKAQRTRRARIKLARRTLVVPFRVSLGLIFRLAAATLARSSNAYQFVTAPEPHVSWRVDRAPRSTLQNTLRVESELRLYRRLARCCARARPRCAELASVSFFLIPSAYIGGVATPCGEARTIGSMRNAALPFAVEHSLGP